MTDNGPKKRFALLERDGTVIVEKHYLKSVADLEILPHAIAGLRKLADQGFGLILVTNQSGVGRGLVTIAEVEAIHSELMRRLSAHGVHLAGIYYCPHMPDDQCECRKPRTGLARNAAVDFGFDPSESLVIGDKSSDVQFGRNLNAYTVLVRTGYGMQHERAAGADAVADNLEDAAYLYRPVI